ncbi:testin [Neocloeon triangulifer]|uniref:testin n=1 Tax=Neocloeon triangulifer TaxID=2078957 RepID=UPI00286F44B8|nr:testin [Neocloeon triangulifer]
MSTDLEPNQGASTPGWVRDLEKRRLQPHKLAHDVGAGAPCLTCAGACPGLDLHFWRKSCRNCKCSKEKHDVIDDGGSNQFEILLGAGNKKPTYKLKFGKDDDKENLLSFEWLPPGITPDVAERYMQEIPEALRPISGTEGAQRRREKLERQVPMHDLDPSKCHSLTDEEVVGLENYRQHLKEGAVGQGRVATLAAMLKELGMNYGALAKDGSVIMSVPLFNEPQQQNNGGAKPVPANKVHQQGQNAPNSKKGAFLEKMLVNDANSNETEEFFPPPPSPHTLEMLEKTEPPSFKPSKPSEDQSAGFLKRPSAYLPIPYGPPRNMELENGNLAESHENPTIPPSGPVTNDVPVEEQQKTNYVAQTPKNKSVSFSDVKTPAIVPKEITNLPQRAQRFENNNIEGDLPADLAGLQLTGPAFEAGHATCMECNLPAAPGDVIVTAERAGPGQFWHPACFVCSTCKELLVDLIYFHKGDKLFCGRHFAEEVNIPRCHACDELIFTTEYTLAEEKYFHVRHFCCIECDTPLAGLKYISREGQPCCLACYEAKFSKVCNTCNKLIGPSESSVIWQEIHWHATEECFCCFNCKKSLLNNKFAVKENQSLCSKECIQAYLRSRVAVTDL